MALSRNWREEQRERIAMLQQAMAERGIAEGRPWPDRVELLAQALILERKAKGVSPVSEGVPSPGAHNSFIGSDSNR